MAKVDVAESIKAQIAQHASSISVGGGLFLKKLASGNYAWRYNYTFGGRQKTASYGLFPEVSCPEAQARHTDDRALLRKGIDPCAERARQRTEVHAPLAPAFKAVADEWLARQSVRWTDRHRDGVERSLVLHVYPHIGREPINRLDSATVLACVRKVEAAGSHETSHRVLQRIGCVFTYAIACGHVRSNPCEGLKGALTPVVHQKMAAIEPDKLRTLLDDLDGYPGDRVTKLGLQMLLLTFVRTGELISARWDEIDWDQAEWNIPSERMKARRPHIVPLSRQALTLLKVLRAENAGSPFLFPGKRSGRPISNNTLLYGLYRLGYHSRMTGHGFRALASTVLHEMGCDSKTIEVQLAHVDGNATRAAYNRAEYISQRHELMQRWADHLDEVRHGGRAIPLRRRSSATT